MLKYNIVIEHAALRHIEFFKKNYKVIAKKIHALLLDIVKTPFVGIGKPEALKFELTGYWSRRITQEHRLVYKLRQNEIVVISCRYHY